MERCADECLGFKRPAWVFIDAFGRLGSPSSGGVIEGGALTLAAAPRGAGARPTPPLAKIARAQHRAMLLQTHEYIDCGVGRAAVGALPAAGFSSATASPVHFRCFFCAAKSARAPGSSCAPDRLAGVI